MLRFYIKNENPTNQLRNLVTATQHGLTAEYISPLFTDEHAFFRLMRNHRNHLQSYIHIDIAGFSGMLRAIGNNNDHTIIYTDHSASNNFCYCFSDPKKINARKLIDNQLEYSKQEFNAFEIIKLLNSIFFPENPTLFNTNSPLRQCRILQNRLFIESDVVWHFNYTINR